MLATDLELYHRLRVSWDIGNDILFRLRSLGSDVLGPTRVYVPVPELSPFPPTLPNSLSSLRDIFVKQKQGKVICTYFIGWDPLGCQLQGHPRQYIIDRASLTYSYGLDGLWTCPDPWHLIMKKSGELFLSRAGLHCCPRCVIWFWPFVALGWIKNEWPLPRSGLDWSSEGRLGYAISPRPEQSSLARPWPIYALQTTNTWSTHNPQPLTALPLPLLQLWSKLPSYCQLCTIQASSNLCYTLRPTTLYATLPSFSLSYPYHLLFTIKQYTYL